MYGLESIGCMGWNLLDVWVGIYWMYGLESIGCMGWNLLEYSASSR